MKILLAILSCARDTQNGFNQAVRETWIQDLEKLKYELDPTVGVDHKFFLGNPVPRAADGSRALIARLSMVPDEVILQAAGDLYEDLPEKVYHLLAWAHKNGYSHVFKCDTDTYVRVAPMLGLTAPWDRNTPRWFTHDYVGTFNGYPPGTYAPSSRYLAPGGRRIYTWCSGGSGYWLSRRAIEVVLANPPDERAICPNLRYGCEDLWIGQLMGPEIKARRLSAFHDDRYHRTWRPDYEVDFTAHFCSQGMNRGFDTGWMYDHHARNNTHGWNSRRPA